MGLISLLLGCDAGNPAPGKDHSGRDSAVADTADTADTGPAPVDADGDGHDAASDCNDADPAVFPGATDWCDGVDQDCDGDPVGPGMCGEWASIADLDTLYWQGEYAGERFSGGPLAEFDAEVLYAADVTAPDGTGMETVFRGLPGDDHRWSGGIVGLWSNRLGVNEVEGFVAAGDFDGDGHDDLWLFCGDFDYPRNDYRLEFGPWSGWPAGGIYADEVDEAVWYETDENNVTLDPKAAHGIDLDGDGFADSLHGSGRGVTLIRGRPDAPGQHDLLREPWLSASSILGAFPMADGDGDGTRDLILLRDSSSSDDIGLTWLSGLDLAGGAGTPAADGWRELATTESWAGVADWREADIGDLDGDGLSDVLAESWHGDDSNTACLIWLSAAAIPTAATIEETEIARACWLAEGAESETYAGRGDIDGDGVLDPTFSVYDRDFYYQTGWHNVGCVLGTTRLEHGGTLDASTVSPCYYGMSRAVPDLDGDGLGDYYVGNVEWQLADTENYGRSDILLGFEIPWDDSSRW